MGTSGTHWFCLRKFRSLFELVQATRASSRDEAGNSGFLSSSDKDLRVPMEIPLRSHMSSRVGAWNSASCSKWKRGVRPPVKLR